MQKKIILFACCFMCAGLIACGTQTENTNVTQNESSSTTEAVQTSKPTETTQNTQTNDTLPEQTEAAQPDKTETVQANNTLSEQIETTQPNIIDNTTVEQSENPSDALTENQALEAIKKYCFTNNPELKNMVDSGETTIYWSVTTNDANEIVVLYRSYTGAQTRYYIDPISGEAYATELVPGIIDEEQRTNEKVNVRNYLT